MIFIKDDFDMAQEDLKAQEDAFDEVNEVENNERMLEVDFDALFDVEKEEKDRQKRLENGMRDRMGEVISCHEIEHTRLIAFNNKKENMWQTKGSKKGKTELKSSEFLKSLFKKYGETNLEYINLELEHNVYRLDQRERFLLYLSWLEKFKLAKQLEIDDLANQFNESAQSLQELRMQEDRSILENAYIIAMTTTGSSRYHSVLKDIGPRIVIVEEAAEVFESHIVSSLSKHCEHLILIGDHIQLRPNPAVYLLAKDFEFDVSLFERLIKNDTKKVVSRFS
jgi:hypothetical protein